MDPLHLEDWRFARQCLNGEKGAIAKLKKTYGPLVRAFLSKYERDESEIEGLMVRLWMDCFGVLPGRQPRLELYDGNAALKSWLIAGALNQLIGLRRGR